MDLFGKKADAENQQLKSQIERLINENSQLKASITPEMKDAMRLRNHLEDLRNSQGRLQAQVETLQQTIKNLNAEIRNKKLQIIPLDDEILYQTCGIYTPHYDFTLAEQYKDRLTEIRQAQKDCVKSGNATTGSTNWTVNGDAKKGSKMVKDMQKLLLRAFNSECDELVEKVKYNTYDTAFKRMVTAANTVSKLGTIMDISITQKYLDLKTDELRLALEYRIKKQEEKEALKEARAELREAAKVQKELEEQRKKLEKEKQHYSKALADIEKQLQNADDESKAALLEKREEIRGHLGELKVSEENLDYREANQRAGYVYVISNIGAFGENVYKIGMTRRLDPYERVSELGDASVPFNFDVHAMIFSDDAPALENALHKAFENKKVNMVNQRREFFNVTLSEIKEVVKQNFDKTVEFIDVPDAEQFRQSLQMKKEISA